MSYGLVGNRIIAREIINKWKADNLDRPLMDVIAEVLSTYEINDLPVVKEVKDDKEGN